MGIFANNVLVSTASPIDLAPDQNGVFTAYLTGFDPAVFQIPAGLFEISFKKNDVEIARTPLTTVPFALTVRGINTGDNIVGVSGNVGVGTTSPTEKLSVAGIVESKNGGFKFPDGSIQTIALSSCTFTLKPVGCGRFPGNPESIAACSIDPGFILVVNSRGFSWQMDFSICYTCVGAAEVCGPPTRIAQVEFD